MSERALERDVRLLALDLGHVRGPARRRFGVAYEVIGTVMVLARTLWRFRSLALPRGLALALGLA
jgi:hypothetical protein